MTTNYKYYLNKLSKLKCSLIKSIQYLRKHNFIKQVLNKLTIILLPKIKNINRITLLKYNFHNSVSTSIIV